jgi:hypothetical protein
MSDDDLRDRFRDSDEVPSTRIAARVVRALPPRSRARATTAAVLGALVAALVAASLAGDLATAVGDVLHGPAGARLEGLALLCVPVITVLILRTTRRDYE